MLTTPLGLKKPETTDQADLTVFVGDNMDLIDSKISSMSRSQVTKLGVVSPYVNDIAIDYTSDFKLRPVEILKFTPGDQDQVNTLATFDNGDSSSFQSDSQIVFDGTMRIKTSYTGSMTNDGVLGSGNQYSYIIDKNKYKAVDSISTGDTNVKYLFQDGTDIKTYLSSSVSLVPKMTSNTAPSGIVTASTGPAIAYMAFDSDLSATHWWNALKTDLPAWLSYQFPSPTIVNMYKICQPSPYNTRAPRDFTFEAWDGSKWIILDTQTNQSGYASNNNYTLSYSIANSTPYIKYRINVTANNGDTNYMGITEFYLYGPPTSKWGVVGTSPVTEAMFINSGASSLSGISNSDIQSLVSSTPKLLEYYTSSSTTGGQVQITAVPIDAKLVIPNGDISLSNVQGIDSITLVANTSGNGVVKTAVSVDSGTTWNTYNTGNAQWENLSLDIVSVGSGGMIPSVLNARTRSDWDIITSTGNANTIRFAYYLDISSSSDVANTDTLSGVFDMRGSWDKAIHGTDYVYGYPLNNTLRVQLISDGDYKINY